MNLTLKCIQCDKEYTSLKGFRPTIFLPLQFMKLYCPHCNTAFPLLNRYTYMTLLHQTDLSDNVVQLRPQQGD